MWSEWVREFSAGNTEVHFAEGKTFRVACTTLRLTWPLFHGIEYDRVGWVIGLVVGYEGVKFLYSSDLQGPMLEDYGKWVIEEKLACTKTERCFWEKERLLYTGDFKFPQAKIVN